MIKTIAFVIGHTINLIGIIIAIPFAILFGLLKGTSMIFSSKRNEQNGADIRALCAELGVPDDTYNRITINQMDRAKSIAQKIGEPGEPHHTSPWNTRLALAIASIYHEDAPSPPPDNNLLNALKNYISDYKETHGKEPASIAIETKTYQSLADQGVFNNHLPNFGNIKIFPALNIEGGLLWTAVEVEKSTQKESWDDFDDEVPF